MLNWPSQRGDNTVRSERMRLRFDDDSAAGAAGTYTASCTVPAGATILDIVVNAVALWNAGTSAAMDVGDATDPNGYFAAINLKATDALAGESLSFESAGGKAGAYIANSQVSPRYAVAARVISAIVTTVGTAATTGETVVDVIYTLPLPQSENTSDFTAA